MFYQPRRKWFQDMERHEEGIFAKIPRILKIIRYQRRNIPYDIDRRWMFGILHGTFPIQSSVDKASTIGQGDSKNYHT